MWLALRTYVCFIPTKGLIRDLSANSSNIAFEVLLASKWWWQSGLTCTCISHKDSQLHTLPINNLTVYPEKISLSRIDTKCSADVSTFGWVASSFKIKARLSKVKTNCIYIKRALTPKKCTHVQVQKDRGPCFDLSEWAVLQLYRGYIVNSSLQKQTTSH